MIIDNKLYSILYKYDVLVEPKKSIPQIMDSIKQRIQPEFKVGIYGVGEEADTLLNLFYEYGITIDVCFDAKKKEYANSKLVKNKTVFKPSEIIHKNVDVIIIGSYKFANEIKMNIFDLGYEGIVINAYEELKEHVDNEYCDYEILFRHRKKYSISKDEDDLEILIKDSLLLKDFVYAVKYIDFYIQKKCKNYSKYISLKQELQELLYEIKARIFSRNSNDIVINWVDALSYYDLESIDFLKKFKEESIFFTNAYTSIPWTTETMKTIMFADYTIEGKLYDKEIIKTDEAIFLKLLKTRGYRFVYSGLPRLSRLFDDETICPIDLYESKWAGSLNKQWNALAYLYEMEDPVCVIIHNLRETHEPFISGIADTCKWFGSTKEDWKNEEMLRQVQAANDYISEQLLFYNSFLSENTIQIYMSDHGRIANSPMDEKKIHTIMMIRHNKIPRHAVTEMFSIIDMAPLLRMLIEGRFNREEIAREYVIIENIDPYSNILVEDILSGRLPREELCQCRGIVTKDDKYFRFADGNEYFFVKDDMENHANNSLFYNRIEYLKKQCGQAFVDIYRCEKFKYARQLYEGRY